MPFLMVRGDIAKMRTDAVVIPAAGAGQPHKIRLALCRAIMRKSFGSSAPSIIYVIVPAWTKTMTMDHIIPLSRGGKNCRFIWCWGSGTCLRFLVSVKRLSRLILRNMKQCRQMNEWTEAVRSRG